MDVDASHEEHTQELWMAGWVSQLGASPGLVTAEGLCVPTSKGWSDFKQVSMPVNLGRGKAARLRYAQSRDLRLQLILRVRKELAAARQLLCAGLPMRLAQRGCLHG